jgi:hypothetical protein
VRGGWGGIKVSISAHRSSGTFLGVGITTPYQHFGLQTRFKRFSAVYLMLKFPGTRPVVDDGMGRETEMEKIDNFRDN